MRNIISAVVQLNAKMYELAKQSKHNHYNLEGSTTNHMLCKLENKALMAAFDYLNGKGIEVAALVFDGSMIIYKRAFTNTNIWIPLIGSKRLNCHLLRNSTEA